MAKVAFQPGHLSDDEARKQAMRCINILMEHDTACLDASEKEWNFIKEMQENIILTENSDRKFVPTYRQLNWLKDLVQKYV